jgi:hypothetical protein
MVLRKILVHKTDDVARVWKKMHNEELHDLYCLLYIIRVTKSRKMDGKGK